MKEIKLTQGQVALVDDEDFEELNRFKWSVHKSGKTYYAERNSPTINGKRTTIKMHHEILGKPPEGLEIDHINGDGLFNLKINLRYVTHRQNCQNKQNISKSSIYPGVSWSNTRKKWESYIQIDGIHKFLGYCVSELEAFMNYKQANETIGEKIIDNYITKENQNVHESLPELPLHNE